jgi:hypothetical protein
LFEDIEIDSVICIGGRPTVCIKDERSRDDFAVEETRKYLWNLGATTILVVERPTRIDVFSTLQRPIKEDRTGNRARLDDETIESLEAVELAIRLRRLVRRIETGTIYRDHPSNFSSEQTVDRLLLENLKAARDLICPQPSSADYRRAHALIGKFLFSCYLLDRGIIGPGYLRQNGLPEAKDMVGLIDAGGRASSLEQLFAALQRDFNGSLFGHQIDSAIADSEVTVLRRLLSGDNLRTGQKSLFKLYDFAFVPVELISSIYQAFLSAEAEADDSSTNAGRARKRTGQRTLGAYYTPPRLAELTVDIATDGWSTLLDKRCLDPACGSGIFLVILFVRMAEEWRNRNPEASTQQRYAAMLTILSKNLCGVDVNLTACLVTCFSLYLAFLDQMEPKEITELRTLLEHDTKRKLLPRILWETVKVRPRPPDCATVHEWNFFKLEPGQQFNLVIGNPPWVSRSSAPDVENWGPRRECKSSCQNGGEVA